MAVPKKRVSKAKKNSRKANWKKKALKKAKQSLSLAKAFLYSKNFNYQVAFILILLRVSL